MPFLGLVGHAGTAEAFPRFRSFFIEGVRNSQKERSRASELQETLPEL